jgi:hypothetical protein
MTFEISNRLNSEPLAGEAGAPLAGSALGAWPLFFGLGPIINLNGKKLYTSRNGSRVPSLALLALHSFIHTAPWGSGHFRRIRANTQVIESFKTRAAIGRMGHLLVS